MTIGSTTNSYNADGVLVQQGTTRYVQDLAAPLSQILGDGISTFISGQERLFAQQSSTKIWYATDALGSVRQTLNDSGAVLGNVAYDSWGQVQQGTVPTFGFTGELQQGTNVYLRARWYNSQRGVFTAKDPFVGMPEQPYSLMPYQYAYSAPTTWTDPSGRCLGWLWGDPSCQFAGTDYTQYDYVGAGQVVVTGLGVAATVAACAGTAGLACVAGAGGAAAVTSWGNQALNNAGQPVSQAVTQVDWGAIGRDAGIAAVSGPIGGGAGKLVGKVCTTGPWCATAVGSAIGSISAGTGRVLTNVLDGDPNTSATDGVLEACLVGAAVGGITGRVSYGVQQWAQGSPSVIFNQQATAQNLSALWKLVPPFARRWTTVAAGEVITGNGMQQTVIAVNRFQWQQLAKYAGAGQVRTEQEAIAFLRSKGLIPQNAIALTSQDLANPNLTSRPHAEEIIMRWAEQLQVRPLGIIASNKPCADICQPLAQGLKDAFGWDFPLQWLNE